MYSDKLKIILLVFLYGVISCTSARRISEISKNETSADLSVSEYLHDTEEKGMLTEDVVTGVGDSVEGGVLMRAVRDTETGEMVASDVIKASTITARFRNVAERAGKVTIEFDITVPEALTDSRWQLRLYPVADMMGEALRLDPVFVTGEKYRSAQLRGYERYRNFVASIIKDRRDFIMLKPLEIFIERHFPETFAMKDDTSFVSEPMAENLFGVRQRDALEHYTRHRLMARNARRIRKSEDMLERVTGGTGISARIDTLTDGISGNIRYRYVQTLASKPGLRKITVSLGGCIFDNGKEVYGLPAVKDIVFYVSSLSWFADMSPRYRTEILERDIHDYTKAVIDFESGQAVFDTLSENNRYELARIRDCVENMFGLEGIVADSLAVTASCSPEGSFAYNETLSLQRAEAMLSHIKRMIPEKENVRFRTYCIPENWESLGRIVMYDSLFSEKSRRAVLAAGHARNPDMEEYSLRKLPEYRYMREKLYPKLRTVRIDFYMHRIGVVKDTVSTSEPDTLYMRGLEALVSMDYRTAAACLGTYGDRNSALAYLAAGYDDKALDVLESLEEESAVILYLKALAMARLGKRNEASESFRKSVEKDRSMLHRGRLDPEINQIAEDMLFN